MPKGRPVGSKNKEKRAFRDRIRAYCESIGADPFEFMAKTIVNRRAKFETRALCAKELAQYLEPKLRSVELSGDPEKPVHITSLQQYLQNAITEAEKARNGHEN